MKKRIKDIIKENLFILCPILVILVLVLILIINNNYAPKNNQVNKNVTTSSTYTSQKSYSNTNKQSSVDTASTTKYYSSYTSFSNKYGTPTTICAHSGCDRYIASTGDTNCCSIHSNKCSSCGCYIDEDAMYCIDCIKKAYGKSTTKSSYSYTHTCYASGCSKEGTYSLEGFNGTEYYCYEHYSKIMNMYEGMFGN